jgi:hypothetical protein
MLPNVARLPVLFPDADHIDQLRFVSGARAKLRSGRGRLSKDYLTFVSPVTSLTLSVSFSRQIPYPPSSDRTR